MALLYVGIWAALAKVVDRELLLPTPASVAVSLMGLLGQGGFWQSIACSLGRILLGYLIGVLLALLLTLLCVLSALARAVFAPLLRIISAMPVASFILLALVWLPSSRVPVLTTALMVLPVVFGPLYRAVLDVDASLLEMMRFFGLPRRVLLSKLYLPSVAPQGIAACITAQGLAWKAGIAAEVLATPLHSIGKGIYETKLYLETPELFAWTAVVILLSLLFEWLVRRAAHRAWVEPPEEKPHD